MSCENKETIITADEARDILNNVTDTRIANIKLFNKKLKRAMVLYFNRHISFLKFSLYFTEIGDKIDDIEFIRKAGYTVDRDIEGSRWVVYLQV